MYFHGKAFYKTSNSHYFLILKNWLWGKYSWMVKLILCPEEPQVNLKLYKFTIIQVYLYTVNGGKEDLTKNTE